MNFRVKNTKINEFSETVKENKNKKCTKRELLLCITI
jgi:hypothetical protein